MESRWWSAIGMAKQRKRKKRARGGCARPSGRTGNEGARGAQVRPRPALKELVDLVEHRRRSVRVVLDERRCGLLRPCSSNSRGSSAGLAPVQREPKVDLRTQGRRTRGPMTGSILVKAGLRLDIVGVALLLAGPRVQSEGSRSLPSAGKGPAAMAQVDSVSSLEFLLRRRPAR